MQCDAKGGVATRPTSPGEGFEKSAHSKEVPLLKIKRRKREGGNGEE